MKVCNGFSAPLQIFRGMVWNGGEGLQYNTGKNHENVVNYKLKHLDDVIFNVPVSSQTSPVEI